jgi:hypothetical protein
MLAVLAVVCVLPDSCPGTDAGTSMSTNPCHESRCPATRKRRRKMRRIGLIVTLALLAAVSATFAGEYYVKHKGDDRRGEPSEERGLVYVFRPATIGAAIKTWAFADDQFIGVSKAKGYYFAQVPAGKRLIWSKAENTSALDVEIEGGKTYYFKQGIRMGFGKARVKMIQIDESEARKYFEKCSFCEPTEEGRQRAAEIAANRLERAEDNAKKKEEKRKKKSKGDQGDK